jgi:hypothetical protein
MTLLIEFDPTKRTARSFASSKLVERDALATLKDPAKKALYCIYYPLVQVQVRTVVWFGLLALLLEHNNMRLLHRRA